MPERAFDFAPVRAEVADRQLDQTREELQAERSRHDLRLSELHEQLAQLVARTPPRRSAAKAPTRKKAAMAS